MVSGAVPEDSCGVAPVVRLMSPPRVGVRTTTVRRWHRVEPRPTDPATQTQVVALSDGEHPGQMSPPDADRPWTNTSLSPAERARGLVAAMTLEQKIAQLHGAMETIDIYSVQMGTAEEMDELADQFRVERHVAAI